MTGNTSTQQLGTIAKKFYRFMGLLGLVSLFAACGNPAADVAPVAQTTDVATQENVADPENVDAPGSNPAPTPTAAAATATPVPTPTVPAEPTPFPAQFVNLDVVAAEFDLTTAEVEGIIDFLHTLALAPEEIFIVTTPALAYLGEANYGEANYGAGDALVFDTTTGEYTIFSKVAWDGTSQVELDATYELKIDVEGEPRWESADPNKESYYGIDIPAGLDGLEGGLEFVPAEYATKIEDTLEAQAFAQANGLAEVVSIAYTSGGDIAGLVVSYDANGNPVAERENEDSEWLPAAPAKEWLFGPEEKVPSLLEGAGLPAQAIVHNIEAKTWNVVSLGSIPNPNEV